MSSSESPNLVEPLEYIIEDVSYIVWIVLKEPVPYTRKSPSILVDPVIVTLPVTSKLPVISTSFDALKYVSPSNQSVSVPPPAASIIRRFGGIPIVFTNPAEFGLFETKLPLNKISPPSFLSKVKYLSNGKGVNSPVGKPVPDPLPTKSTFKASLTSLFISKVPPLVSVIFIEPAVNEADIGFDPAAVLIAFAISSSLATA